MLRQDIEKSREVFEYFKDLIKPKKCYNNVFHVVSLSPKTFREGKWKVAYGYVTVFDNVLCRHCFIVDEHGRVIDPTLCDRDREYYAMKIYADIDEYFADIEREDYYPALDRVLRESEQQAQKWANDNGYVLIG